jgi:predicted Zn-dependent protease
LSTLCFALQDAPAGARLQMLLAYCLYRNEDPVNAKTRAEAATQQNAKDPLVQALYSYLLKKSGADEQANVALEQALRFDTDQRFKLPLILKARSCEEQNQFPCALDSWKKVISLDANFVPAIVGVARAQVAMKRNADAKATLGAPTTRFERYRPYLELKQKISEGVSGAH